MRSYAVIGLGAIGGLYGTRLAANGHDVHFVVRNSADHIAEHGIHLDSVDGDIHLTEVSVYDDPAAVPEVDVVLVALKTTANNGLEKILPPLVTADTTVVMLQNGLGVEAAAAGVLKAAGMETAIVLGGMCFVCAQRIEPGHIRHVDYGTVSMAQYRPDGTAAGVTGIMKSVADDLNGAGVRTALHEDLTAARWRKLVWNIPYNGLSVVHDAGTDELMADPWTRQLIRELMEEVVAGAAAAGRRLGDGFVDKMLADTDAMTPYSTSMKLDYDAGRALELDAIYRAPLDVAAIADVALPRIDALHRELRFLDVRNRS